MTRHLLVLTLVLTSLTLTSCTSPIGIPEPKLPMPTIGPVQQGSGALKSTNRMLTASTNCAEIGEIVTFTARIGNGTATSVTISETPLIDIVLTSNDGSNLVQRWSESDQYPSVLNPIIAPGEIRTYQWQWKADARFAANPKPDRRGVWAKLMVGRIVEQDGGSTPPGGVEIYLGVDTTLLAGPGAHILCADMRR